MKLILTKKFFQLRLYIQKKLVRGLPFNINSTVDPTEKITRTSAVLMYMCQNLADYDPHQIFLTLNPFYSNSWTIIKHSKLPNSFYSLK